MHGHCKEDNRQEDPSYPDDGEEGHSRAVCENNGSSQIGGEKDHGFEEDRGQEDSGKENRG